jgi:uncharacterized protein YuzE
VNQTYDADADALYITVRAGEVAATREVDERTFVDVDASDHVLGIEVLQPARDWPLDEVLERFVVGDTDAAMMKASFARVGFLGLLIGLEPPDRTDSKAVRQLLLDA